MSANPPIGARVRFKGDRFGLLEHLNDPHFASETVGGGDEGVYDGGHPDPALSQLDWHVVRVNVDGRDLFAPVHRSQFEVLDA